MAEPLRSEDIGIQIKANLEVFDKVDERFDKLKEKTRLLNEQFGGLFKESPNTRFFSTVNRQLEITDKRLSAVQESSKAFNSNFKELSSSMGTFENRVKGANTAQKDFTSANRSATTSINKTREAVNKFNKTSTSHVSRGMDTATKSAKKMHSSTRSLSETGSKFLNVGRNMAITSTAIGAAMLKGANDAVKLQNQYRVINNLAVYGGEKQSEVTKNVGKMQDQASKYSSKYGVAQNKLSAGYEELIRRGYTSNQVLAAQKTFLQGSLASGDDYTDVVHNGAAALEQFGLRTQNTNQMMKNTKTVINQMAYAADLTATDFQGMGDAFRYVGNTAHTANQSVAETAAGIGVLSNAGMEDTVAGTGYRKVLNSFLSPNMGKMSQQAPIMEKFGWTKKSFEDSKGNLKSIADLMDMVKDKTKNMGGAEKADVFKRFFGTTGQEAAIALSKDTKGLRELSGEVAKSQNMKGGGYIAQLSQKNLMSAQEQINIFKQAISGLGISFATTVLPNITHLIQGMDKLLYSINQLPEESKKFVTESIAIAAAIAPVSLALGGLIKGLSMAKNAWVTLRTAMVKPISVAPLQSAANQTTAAAGNLASQTGTMPLATGTRAGATHFAKGRMATQWGGSSLLGKAAVVGLGADIGLDFVKASKEGLDTKQGGKDLWSGAGKAVGGGVGLYLGGPAGALVGSTIGDAAGKAMVKWATWDQKNGTYSPNGNHSKKQRNYNAKHQSSLLQSSSTNASVPGGAGIPNIPGQKSEVFDKNGKKSGNGKKSSSKKSSKHNSPFDSLPKDARSATQTATRLVSSANVNWARASADMSMKQTSKIAADQKKMLSSTSTKYGKAYSALSKYVDKSGTKSNKAASYLEKIGATSASSAQKALSSQSSYNTKHLQMVKNDYAVIERDEKSGGKNRERLIQKLNQDVLRLTDKGHTKQMALMRSLNSRTSKLSVSQYKTVVDQSNKAYKSTKSTAKKSYDSQVSNAQKEYNHTLKSAKQVYGVHSDEYKRIKKYAQKQYDSTTDKAHKQYTKTVKWAEKQRRDVVAAAKKEAGDAADAFSTAAKNVGSSIPTLIEQNMSAFGGHYQKPKSNDQSFHDNADPAGNLAKGAKKLQKKETTSVLQSGPSVKMTSSSSVLSKAAGGSIFKHGMSMVGENGFEVLQRGKMFKLIGQHGAQLMQVQPGDRIYKHADALAMTKGKYGQRIPGFAEGNATAASASTNVTAKVKGLGSTERNTKRSMTRISKSITDGYSKSTKKSNSSISKFQTRNLSDWKAIDKSTSKYTGQIQKNTISDFDVMQKDSQKQMNQLHSGMTSAAKATASDFGDAMDKLKPYAHTAMSGAITSLNGGITGINSTLSQFGGNKSVLKPIHYATGSNGPIGSDQMAVLNDARSGPRQELVSRNGQLLKPTGNDVLTPLRKGDEVLNGSQVEQIKPYLPHFAKGTGVSNKKLLAMIEKNSSEPNAAWKNDFTNHLGKSANTALGSGVHSLSKQATNSKGIPWNAAAWSVMNNAAQSSGGAGGGAWRHNPGMAKTNGFGAARSFGSHDGNDFSGPLGSAILAMHGGKVAQIGPPGHGWPYSQLGDIIRLVSSDGYQQIYQEFGTMRNIKVAVGDVVKTGQKIATLGKLNGAGSGSHVHVGLAKGSVFDHGGSSTRGWLDITKMHGKSSGTAGMKKKANSKLEKFATNQLKAAGVLPWITKHITPLTEDSGSGGTSAAPTGSHKHWLEQAGIPVSQFGAYNSIITPESGWNPKIHNPSSSAYGLPQALPGSKMASAGSDWKTNPITQLKWMKGYVKGRYGGINQALSFRKSHGWYARGGKPPLNQWVNVNEEGQELFKTKKSGKIIPHKESQRLVTKASTGTKISPQYNVKVEVNGNADDDAITAAVKRALKEHDEELIARINAQSGDNSSYEII